MYEKTVFLKARIQNPLQNAVWPHREAAKTNDIRRKSDAARSRQEPRGAQEPPGGFKNDECLVGGACTPFPFEPKTAHELRHSSKMRFRIQKPIVFTAILIDIIKK